MWLRSACSTILSAPPDRARVVDAFRNSTWRHPLPASDAAARLLNSWWPPNCQIRPERPWIGAGSSLAAGGPGIAGSARIWPARPCFVARLGCSRRGLPGGGDVGRSPCLDGMCAVGGCRGGGLGRRGRRGLLTGDGRGSWWSATSAVRAARSRWTSTTVGRGAPSPGVPATMKSDAFSGCGRSPGQVFGRVVGTGAGSGETLGRRRRPRQWRRLVGVGSLLGGLVEVLSRLSLCSSFGRKL